MNRSMILRSCRQLAVLAAPCAALLLTGCSLLLPFDLAELPCDAAGECREGYFCNDDNLCEKEPENVACNPACGALETCERGVCQPTCAGRACPAGEICDDEVGLCRPKPGNAVGGLGSPCSEHSECRGSYSDAFCLRPWGEPAAATAGVCTRPCEGDGVCGSLECITFPGGAQALSLCADPSFMPCENESDCTASGLSCGTYTGLVGGASSDTRPVLACRSRTKGAEIGNQFCNAPEDCVTGLCIRHAGKAVCTTPCADGDPDNCTDAMAEAICLDVLLDETQADGQPTVRAPLCVASAKKLLTPCTTDSDCGFDAPSCRLLPELNQYRCTTRCHGSNKTCPAGSTCKEVDAGTFGWPNYCGMLTTSKPN